MNPRSSLLCGALSLLALGGSRLHAETTAYYADLNSMGTMVEVSVNGTRIFSGMDVGGQTHSQFITPYLVSGKNKVEVTCRLPEGAEADPNGAWVQCDIASAPAEKMRTAQEPGDMLVSRRIEPLQRVKLAGLKDGEFEILSGEMVPETGPIRFANKGERRWAWGIRLLDQEKVLRAVPAALSMTGLMQTLALGEVHFIDSASGAHVFFSGLKLPKGGATIALDQSTLKQGLEYLSHGRFDTVWLFGFSAAGAEAVDLYGLDLIGSRQTITTSDAFEVKLPFPWSWEKGTEVKKIGTDPALRAEVIAFLSKLHATLDTKPVEAWAPFFEPKLVDIAKAMGKPEDEMRAGQKAFFQGLAATEGWKLEPFDPQRLRLVAANDRVIDVSYIDGPGPIISVPLKKAPDGQPDRFTMPLSVSKIGGEWKVTR